MSTVVTNPPRRLRSHVRRLVNLGELKPVLLSPKQSGKSGWRYFARYNGCLVAVSKKSVATRDLARQQAPLRFGGQKAGDGGRLLKAA